MTKKEIYYQKNKERILKQHKVRYKKNRKRILERQKELYIINNT